MDKPSEDLCLKLGRYLTGSILLPIDKLFHILHTEYSRTQLAEMEAEFLLQFLIKYNGTGEGDIDSGFISKLYAITAILKQPMFVTHSLLSFYNTLLICNGIPSGIDNYDDINLMPSYYVSRTFMALDTILPDDMDPTEMYVHPNIKTFIFKCHVKDDNLVMGPYLEQFQDDFFTYMYSTQVATKLLGIVSELESELVTLRRTLIGAIIPSKDEVVIDAQRDIYNTFFVSNLTMSDIKASIKQTDFKELEKGILEGYPDDTYKGIVVRKAIDTFMYAYLYWYSEDEVSSKSTMVVLLTADSVKKLANSNFKDKLEYLRSDGPLEYYLAGSKSTIEKGMSFAKEHKVDNLLKYKYIKDLEGDAISNALAVCLKLYPSLGPPNTMVLVTGDLPDYQRVSLREHLAKSLPGWTITLIQ